MNHLILTRISRLIPDANKHLTAFECTHGRSLLVGIAGVQKFYFCLTGKIVCCTLETVFSVLTITDFIQSVLQVFK